MLWSSALHSPQKGEHYIWCAHEGTVHFSVCKLWFSPSQTHCPGIDHGDFRHLDQKMSTVTKQCQMRVAVSAAVVCLRGANPSSTEILITTTPLTTLYTSNLIHLQCKKVRIPKTSKRKRKRKKSTFRTISKRM